MSKLPQKTIEELVVSSKEGNEKAFHAIFELLSGRLFSYALAHTRNRDDALDLVQDTFIDLWNALDKFKYKNDESFYGFVFLVLKRKLYRHYKRTPRTVELDEKYIADNYVLEVEDYRYLEKVMGTLPKNYQELLRLRYWSAFSFREIAAVMDVKEGTAKVWHHRALKALNMKLDNKLTFQ